ncbi:MAG: tRNA (adenosine(37)-N6)-dimethylallyltransferase MiaA [Gemmataceae bacterium]|nr:tRNA (adenosine(37)-N6)-dimethylallyltransferase MiaA [Gemmataceae bacterium]MDW8243661.1 tRNA (adenosine(37)-N6)-dimethylallyltransferase MiaA [Thermogemmata sp.]
MDPLEHAYVLTGPTASGKSTLAIRLAELMDGEIIALDSMTVYRGMDIGTAKPSVAERARVPHHLIDVLDPWQGLSVAWWLQQAERACQEILARGRRPLLVGGTPFYLKVLFYGLFPGPPADEKLRRQLEAEAAQQGRAALHARLAQVDPVTAARLHPNDLRRVVRALEVFLLTGQPISTWQTTWDTPAFASQPRPPLRRLPAVVLTLPRDLLYRRIEQRIDQMLQSGWLDEVQRLRQLPHPLSREARQALGYRQILDYLEGRLPSWELTLERIRIQTRQFAKHQLTWFRHLPQLHPVAADAPNVTEQILHYWHKFST